MSSIRSSEEFTYSIDKLERDEEHLQGSYSNIDMTMSLPVSEKRPLAKHNEPEIVNSVPTLDKPQKMEASDPHKLNEDSHGSFSRPYENGCP